MTETEVLNYVNDALARSEDSITTELSDTLSDLKERDFWQYSLGNTTSVSSSSTPLSIRSILRVWITDDSYLQEKSVSWIKQRLACGIATTSPYYYAYEDSTLWVYPEPDTSYTINYDAIDNYDASLTSFGSEFNEVIRSGVAYRVAMKYSDDVLTPLWQNNYEIGIRKLLDSQGRRKVSRGTIKYKDI